MKMFKTANHKKISQQNSVRYDDSSVDTSVNDAFIHIVNLIRPVINDYEPDEIKTILSSLEMWIETYPYNN